MRAFATWIGRNADDVIALVLALCVGVLGLFDVASIPEINNTILLILAARTAADLRDRARRRSSEHEWRTAVHGAVGQLTGIAETQTGMRSTLDAIAGVRLLPGAEIASRLEQARRDTTRWIFKGGTGTYVRAVTLPACVENARRTRRSLSVKLQIIDPTDEGVCATYARFRHSVSPNADGTGELWTIDRTRKEAFATILAACWHQERYDLLDIEVRLAKSVTTVRWDLSSSCVILTQEDPRGTGLLFEHGWLYYDYWDIELRASLDQCVKAPLEHAKSVELGAEPTVETTRRLFVQLGLPLPRSFTDRDVSDVVQKAIQARDPYQR